MEQTQKHGAAGLVLKWILLIAADIAVVVLIPILFVYTQSAPVTPEGLAGLDYFSGCEITAIAGRYTREDGTLDIRGSDADSWVLYENSAGEVRAVCLEWDLVAPRYRVKADTDTLIPADEDPYTFITGGIFTKQQVTVTGQKTVETDVFHYSDSRRLAKTAYGAGVAVLLLAEFAVGKAIQKKKNKR